MPFYLIFFYNILIQIKSKSKCILSSGGAFKLTLNVTDEQQNISSGCPLTKNFISVSDYLTTKIIFTNISIIECGCILILKCYLFFRW